MKRLFWNAVLLLLVVGRAESSLPQGVHSATAEIEVLGTFQIDSVKAGAKIFLDRGYVLDKYPDFLDGTSFLRGSIGSDQFRVAADGLITVLTPESNEYNSSPIAMAVSKDGLYWERPEFDVRPGSNIVSPIDITPDSWTVVRNWDAARPEEKWILYVQPPCIHRGGRVRC